MGATHAIVMRTGPLHGGMLATSHHLASVSPARLGNLNQSDEYRQLLSTVAVGSAVRLTNMVPRDAILHTEMYQTTLRSLDGGLAVYGLQSDGPDMVVTAICRSAALDPDFDDDGVALLRAVLPHLVAVTGIAARMENERRDKSMARDALDTVKHGIVVLGEDKLVLHVNAAAEALLVRGDRVRRSRAKLIAADHTEDFRLQSAIDAVLTFDRCFDMHHKAAAARTPFQVVLGRRTPGWPLIATAVPAGRTGLQGVVVVHLRDPATSACLSRASLKTEFGLTPREATLVCELADGATLIQSASQMEISAGTARQYLKTIFLKTNVTSQSQMLRLVCR